MRERNEIRAMLPLSLAALTYASDMVGVTEDFINGAWTNWGPEVKEFLFAAGITTPAPWCAGFVNWCAEQGAYDKEMTSPLEEVELQAYVQSYAEWALVERRFVPPEEAGTGDLFILYYDNLGRYGHIGFVVEIDLEEGWFTTIEGNTNDQASREGFKVAERRRSIKPSTKFIRWD